MFERAGPSRWAPFVTQAMWPTIPSSTNNFLKMPNSTPVRNTFYYVHGDGTTIATTGKILSLIIIIINNNNSISSSFSNKITCGFLNFTLS